jgi:hypothetical protein
LRISKVGFLKLGIQKWESTSGNSKVGKREEGEGSANKAKRFQLAMTGRKAKCEKKDCAALDK